jgi:hypothetical protein
MVCHKPFAGAHGSRVLRRLELAEGSLMGRLRLRSDGSRRTRFGGVGRRTLGGPSRIPACFFSSFFQRGLLSWRDRDREAGPPGRGLAVPEDAFTIRSGRDG